MSDATMIQALAGDTVRATQSIAHSSPICGDVAHSGGTWFHRITTVFGLFGKDLAFFELLEHMANWTVASAEQLQRLSKDFPNTEKAIQLLRRTEYESGRLVRTTLVRLRRAFLTPFDRQDIHLLMSELDAVVQIVATLAKRIPLYRLSAMEPQFADQTDVLLVATRVVRQVVFQLRKTRSLSDIRDKLIEIHHHESMGDDNHHAAMSRLFDGTMGPLEVLKWKQLYEYIEEAIDGCEDVSNTLTRLMLKGA